ITAAIVASDTTLDIGQSLTLTAVGSGATQWTWTAGNATLSTAPSFSYIPSQAGYVSVELAAANAYCSLSTSLVLTVGGVCPQYFYRDYARSVPNALGISQLRPQTVEPTRDGGHLVIGYVLTQGASLTKYSAGGAQQWQRVLLGTSLITNVDHAPDGSYAVAGFVDATQSVGFMMKCDASGQVLWAKRFPGVKWGRVIITSCASGGYYGLVQRIASSVTSTWVVFRADTDGNLLWSLGLTSDDGVADIQSAADGSLMIGLGRAGLAKLNDSGQLVFAKRYGSGAAFFLKQERRAILTDGNDTYLMSGWNNGYLWKTDAQGEVVWGRYSSAHLRMTVLPGEGLLVCRDEEVQKLSAVDGQMAWAKSTDGSFAIAGDEESLHTLQGPRNGRALYVSKKVGAWGALRMYEFNILDGERAGCVGDIPAIGSGQSASIGSLDFTLNLGNLPPNWEPFSASAPSDTNHFDVTRYCNEERCKEICDNGRDDDGNSYVDCYDPVCSCSWPDLGCRDTLPLADIKGRVAWMSPTDQVSVVAVPLVGNLNPLTDSLPEIIVSTAPSSINGVGARLLVFRGDGSNAASPDQIIVPGGYLDYPMPHPTIADLDGDGRVELIIMNAEGFVYIFTDYQPGTNPCMKFWMKSEINSNRIGMRIYPADFDHDGISELYSGPTLYWIDFSAPGGPYLRSNLGSLFTTNLYGAFSTLNTVYPSNTSIVANLSSDPSECTACPVMEIAVGDLLFSAVRQGNAFVSNQVASLCPDTKSGFGYVAVGQLSPLSGSLTPITLNEVNNTAQVCDPVPLRIGSDATYTESLICIANVFDDREAGYQQDMPEMLVGRGGFLYCLNAQSINSPWWQVPTGLWAYRGRAVTAFDFNGDGYDEIVLHD
ncbi:MAG TPA: hypothetical protein PKD78_08140, partial [Saprospiraceae bacterium]|nr:hypothetical protein [Saprospiraceae bacterium]